MFSRLNGGVFLKDTNKLVALGVVVLLALSWYSLISSGIEPQKEYNENLKNARNKAAMGVYVDADAYYQEAQKIHDNLALRQEIVKFYKDSDQIKKLMTYAEGVTKKYSKDNVAYEYLAEEYLENEDYDSFYELIAVAKRRKVKSEKLVSLVDKVAYDYSIDSKDFEDVKEISGGMWACKIDKGTWGFVDTRGKSKVLYQYDHESYYNADGLAPVKNGKGVWVLINRDGQTKFTDVEKKEIEECGPFTGQLMYAKIDGKYKYLDKDFKVVLEGYDDAGTFNGGVAPVKKDGRWILINEKGEQIGEESFDDVRFDEKKIAFRNGVCFGRQKGKYYLINANGQKVSETGWTNADVFHDSTYAAVCENNQWGFIDNTGNVVIKCQYQLARSFSNGLAGVLINNKWGFIDEKGELKIDSQFEDVKYFSNNGTVFVQEAGVNRYKWNILILYSSKK